MTFPMQKYGLAAVAGLAFAASAFAQTTAKPAQPTNQPKTAITTAREANSGMATGKREAQSGQASGTPTSNSTHAHETVEYKDPEDMTTRYRPGNNKTTTVPTTTQSATSADAAKPTGDKKDVGFPACDGASKDAAKCAANPSASPSTHVNKVEAITIKQ